MSRFLVDDSGPVEHELKTDSCQYVRFFRLGGQIYGEGTFGSSFGTWHYRIFTVTSSDSLRLVDTLPGEFGFDFLRTDDAVYMKGYRSVYKFTQKGSKWIMFSDEDDFRGPLFLDRFGRASMLYTPTRRIMLIDSLPGM